MRLTLVILLALTLGGCGGKWCKPGATARDFERDQQRCMNEAAKVAAAWGSPGNPFMIADDTSKCLQLEYGYERCSE